MNRKKAYLIIQLILCILLAGLLIAAAVGIYREGLALRQAGDALAWIYTKEKAADAFAPIAPVFFGAIGLMAAGLILGIQDSRLEKPVQDDEITRNLLLSRMSEPSEAIQKEQHKERGIRIGGWIAFGVCMIPVFIYVIQPSHFPPDDLERMFSSLLWGTVPWAALGMGCLVISQILTGRSIRKQIAAIKQQQTQERQGDFVTDTQPEPGSQTDRTGRVVRIIVFAAALAMITAGVLNGSMRDVLIKAINLCTECVGLG